MANGYDAAVTALYRAPLDQFVAERKRLAQELKVAGDKEGATRLGKLGRPPLSAWAVNQLWWHARASFEQLLAAAEGVRAGDSGAPSAHRETLAKLRARAAALLAEHGHAAPDATLRRVATTLAALAASGGFDPEPPGALAADRDPPGFDVAATLSPPRSPATAAAHAASPAPASAREAEPIQDSGEAERREKAEAEARRRRDAEAAEAARRQLELEKERERRRAERAEVQHELEQARARARAVSLERERLQQALAQNDTELSQTRAAVQELEGRLAAFDRYERLG